MSRPNPTIVGQAPAPPASKEVGGPPQDPRLGKVLHDRYRIARKIADGGMGTVFEGEHLMIKRRVAIKCLHAQYAQDEDVVKRFHNEALAVSAIGHPNIIEALDMGRMEDGSLYVVFELLEGNDLGHEIDARGPLPVERVLHVAMQACDALEAAHEKGIVHRDLKPENIFLVRRPRDDDFVKVLDFGISKLTQGKGISRLTAAGNVMGTPHYMAPEQASGKDVDGRADLYSLGVVMFVALTGDPPLDADSVPALMMKICTERPPLLRRLRPEVPEALETLIDRLLSKRPNERFASAAALRDALRTVEAGGAVGAPRGSPVGQVTAPHAAAQSGVVRTGLVRSGAAEHQAGEASDDDALVIPTSRGPLFWFLAWVFLGAVIGGAVLGFRWYGGGEEPVAEDPGPVASEPATDETPAIEAPEPERSMDVQMEAPEEPVAEPDPEPRAPRVRRHPARDRDEPVRRRPVSAMEADTEEAPEEITEEPPPPAESTDPEPPDPAPEPSGTPAGLKRIEI